MIDLHPAAQRLTDLTTSIRDDQLGLPTPCPETSVGDLIDHLSVALGRDHAATSAEIDGATSFITSFDVPRDGSLFGPIVPVPENADQFDRLLGLAGRAPRWRPPGRVEESRPG